MVERSSPTTPPERRQYWTAAIVLFVVIVGLTGLATLFMDKSNGGDPVGSPPETVDTRPSAIPRPNSGVAPRSPTDRGGWEQYLVFGLTLLGMAATGGLAWRSSRRARARRPPGPVADRTAPPPPAGVPRP